MRKRESLAAAFLFRALVLVDGFPSGSFHVTLEIFRSDIDHPVGSTRTTYGETTSRNGSSKGHWATIRHLAASRMVSIPSGFACSMHTYTGVVRFTHLYSRPLKPVEPVFIRACGFLEFFEKPSEASSEPQSNPNTTLRESLWRNIHSMAENPTINLVLGLRLSTVNDHLGLETLSQSTHSCSNQLTGCKGAGTFLTSICNHHPCPTTDLILRTG